MTATDSPASVVRTGTALSPVLRKKKPPPAGP